jgi:hypothetical protein
VSNPVEITARIQVPQPQERVWHAVVDWPRQGEWMLATRVHGDHGQGAHVVARTGLWLVGFTDTMVITEWQPPRRAVSTNMTHVARHAVVTPVGMASARQRAVTMIACHRQYILI